MQNKVVFTNGVFDLVHRGHIELLNYCKSLGDCVVGIDTDARVRKIKGNERPINSQENRKFLLESLRSVDKVVFFSSKEELQALYISINPDFFVKGSEWTEEQIRQIDNIPPRIQIKIFSNIGDYSSTNTIKKIHSMKRADKIYGNGEFNTE